MTISFNSIPNTLRVPFVAVEISSTAASQGLPLLAYRALIVGQKLSTGSATADTAIRVTSTAQVITLAGRGSMLHRQYLAWAANNTSTEVWIGVLADNGAGVAATGTIVVGGPATAAGTIALYLGGERITTAVALNDASTAIATNIAASINANLDIPVTASVASSTVTITYRHKGLAGNSYDVRANYLDSDATPAGVTLTITAVGSVVAGTTNPVLTNLIAAISDLWFQIIAHPYTDATSLTAIEAEMLSRFGPMRMMDGVAITAASGSLSTLTTLGLARNSAQSVIMAPPGVAPPTPPMEMAAAVAAQVAFAAAIDPARPFQTLALQRVLPPIETDQFAIDTERDLLLHDGIGTTRRAAGGVVQIDRVITTYQKDSSGSPDTAYLDATTMLTLLYLRYSFRTRMRTKYSRHKLANDGTRFGSGQAVLTPLGGKAEAVDWFAELESQGLVENADQFKRDLVVERDTGDPNRLNFLLPPDLINQLIVQAAQIQFRL